jgi:biotin carboxyl carrier protein
MRFDVRIGEVQGTVEASPLDEQGRSRITVGGAEHLVQVRSVAPHHVHVAPCRGEQDEPVDEERNVTFFAARCPEGMWIWAGGRARLVRDTGARRAGRGPGGTSPTVTPPMPAVVTKILVELGQSVDQGQALVVVSAMKMEMTLSAPHAGTVAAINTEEGAKVSPGDLLVEVEPSEQAGAGEEAS